VTALDRRDAAPAADEGAVRAAPWRVHVGVAVVLLLLLLPFVPLVLASLAEAYFHPQVLPARWSTRAWRIVLDPDGASWAALRDTVTVAVLVTVVSLVIAVPAGRALGTRNFQGKRAVELLLLAPVLVPAIAVAIGIHVVFLRLGLAGGTAGVVLVHLIPATPYVVLLSAGVFANADVALEAQARSLGANRWQTYLHVTLPLVGPGSRSRRCSGSWSRGGSTP
jgi:putative spermidine/putrescine transport system permease protein